MTTIAFQVEPFAPKQAHLQGFVALNRLCNGLNAERSPDDSPIPLAETLGDFGNLPPVFSESAWVVWEQERIVGFGECWFKTTDENSHMIHFSVEVAPEYRRQGIGRELLRAVAERAASERRRLMQTTTYGAVPVGEMLLRRLGAQLGQATHANRLDLRQLDCGLVQRWLAQAVERASDFELLVYEGAYPEEQLEALAALFNVMNSAPHDELDVGEWKTTTEQVRQFEAYFFAQGKERWSIVARHQASGELAGFTQTTWSPDRPELLEQLNTGVLPKYRNRGLGRWLKAAMLDKVLRERPQVKFVRTGNADSNTPMLNINHALGFRQYLSSYTWQVETSQVLDYLRGQRTC